MGTFVGTQGTQKRLDETMTITFLYECGKKGERHPNQMQGAAKGKLQEEQSLGERHDLSRYVPKDLGTGP